MSEINCYECKETFDSEDLITIHGKNICAYCKPTYLQKIEEGVVFPDQLVIADIWLRIGAKLLDGVFQQIILTIIFLLMGIVGLIIWFAFSLGNPFENEGQPSDAAVLVFIITMGLIYFLAIITPIIYCTYFVGKYQATPGKMVCGIKIVNADGSRLSYLKSFGRYFAEAISGFTFGVGYLLAVIDKKERKSLHDIICSTRVIKKENN
ncbi:MAG: hypothetical protein COA79_08205 [Planctomycetota bacterium]|nr:MAG: hypothetical protein COA79_08205 [Planctomycetota bacterium]